MLVQVLRSHAFTQRSPLLAILLSEAAQARMHQAEAAGVKHVRDFGNSQAVLLHSTNLSGRLFLSHSATSAGTFFELLQICSSARA